MDYSLVSDKQAVALLSEWKEIGHDLPSLAKLKKTTASNGIIVLIPGYRCNQWYQVGKPFSAYRDAMVFFGELLDKTCSKH
ncbi:hypothetical protein WG68_13135 [Arsukibacterium ikkense]|uniref:Uncharacterized protein n=1 Tax=Arsukibacterium ikkense TaxID=336831 RepID=A0A0M2V6J7_9GAMM|nr:hypothetical protein [Arsukibacterium ikkense]KKO44783.1 hypothetical protein WG68_13135 [Arsukibacterium ikkense]